MTDYRFCPSINDARIERDTPPDVAVESLRTALLDDSARRWLADHADIEPDVRESEVAE